MRGSRVSLSGDNNCAIFAFTVSEPYGEKFLDPAHIQVSKNRNVFIKGDMRGSWLSSYHPKEADKRYTIAQLSA